MISFALTGGVHYHDFDLRRLLCANRFCIFFLSCESLTSRQASASIACILIVDELWFLEEAALSFAV